MAKEKPLSNVGRKKKGLCRAGGSRIVDKEGNPVKETTKQNESKNKNTGKE